MYNFTSDGTHLLFLDCFGLTRLSRPNKVKTSKQLRGSWCGLAQLSHAGDRALVYAPDQSLLRLLEFPGLTSARSYKKYELLRPGLHPDGAHLIQDGLSTTQIAGLPRVWSGDLAGPSLEPIDLLEESPPGWSSLELISNTTANELRNELERYSDNSIEALTVGPDGTFLYATVDSGAGVPTEDAVTFGRFREATRSPTQHWKAPIRLSRRRHQAWPEAGTVLIVGLDPKRQRAWGALIDAKGRRRDYAWPSLSMPVRSGSKVAYQPDEDRVVVEDLETGDKLERSISEATARSMSVKKPPRLTTAAEHLGDLENTGRGDLLFHHGGPEGEERLLLLPWHRETLIDLIEGIELPRKLPAVSFPIRRELMRAVARARAFAAEVNIDVEPSSIQIDDKKLWYKSFYRCTAGEQSFASDLVYRGIRPLFFQGTDLRHIGAALWPAREYGGLYGQTGRLAAGVRDELLRGLEIFDRHKIPLIWADSIIDDLFPWDADPKDALIEKDALKLLLCALLESAADRPGPYLPPKEPTVRLAERVHAWDGETLERGALEARVKEVAHNPREEGLFSTLIDAYFDH